MYHFENLIHITILAKNVNARDYLGIHPNLDLALERITPEFLSSLGEERVDIIPGEFEMEALAAGALRALTGEEILKEYTGEPVFRGFDHLKSHI